MAVERWQKWNVVRAGLTSRFCSRTRVLRTSDAVGVLVRTPAARPSRSAHRCAGDRASWPSSSGCTSPSQLSRASNELPAPGERSRTESRLRARTNSPRQALAGLPFCDGRRASVVLSESGGARRLGHDGGFPAVRAVVGTSAFGIGNGGGRFDMIARRGPVLVTAQSPRVVYRGHAARDDGQTVGSRATAQFISSPGGLRGRSCEAPGPNRACICVVTPRRDAGSLRLDRRAADDAGPTALTKTWRRKRPSSSRICTGGRHPGGHRLRMVYDPNTTTSRLADGREMAILEAVPGSRLSC